MKSTAVSVSSSVFLKAVSHDESAALCRMKQDSASAARPRHFVSSPPRLTSHMVCILYACTCFSCPHIGFAERKQRGEKMRGILPVNSLDEVILMCRCL